MSQPSPAPAQTQARVQAEAPLDAASAAGAPALVAHPAAAPPGVDSDPNCPGLQPPRPDEDVREVDVVSLNPDHLWHLFCNASVHGGYLGKSVINHLVSKHDDFASAYPGGKFSKNALNVESQKSCFVRFCNDADHLDSVHDVVIQKIQALPSLRSKMRCVNVPIRLAQAAAAAAVAAQDAADGPPKAILNDNMSPAPPRSPLPVSV